MAAREKKLKIPPIKEFPRPSKDRINQGKKRSTKKFWKPSWKTFNRSDKDPVIIWSFSFRKVIFRIEKELRLEFFYLPVSLLLKLSDGQKYSSIHTYNIVSVWYFLQGDSISRLRKTFEDGLNLNSFFREDLFKIFQ